MQLDHIFWCCYILHPFLLLLCTYSTYINVWRTILALVATYIRSMTVLSLFTEYPFVALLYRKYKCHYWSNGHIYMKSNSAWSLLQNMHNSISKVYTYMHIVQELFTSIYIMHGTVHLHFHPWHRVLVRSLYKPLPAAVLEKVKREELEQSMVAYK